MMFTFYNTSDGRILFASDLQAEENAKNIINVTDGAGYISGEYSADLYTVIDGEAVKKSDLEIQQQHEAQSWYKLRVLRDSILQSCDWTQAPDAPVDQAAWAAYRQQLRDLPANTVDPENPVWPTTPA